MIEGKIIIPADSAQDILIQDVRGYSRIKSVIMNEKGLSATAYYFCGFGASFVDKAVKSQEIGRDSRVDYVFDTGWHFVKIRVKNTCFTSPIELSYRLELS
ncbi:MAG TPA: hypothetical protein VGK06_15465 [Methanosarcina sp.]|jgi:hypothetical protein